MGVMAFQITSLTIVYSTVYSGEDQRKHQSSVTGEFPAQRASSAENMSIIWWRHHEWIENSHANNVSHHFGMLVKYGASD